MSVIDVPFSHGTLAVNSEKPDAFSKQDIVLLEKMAQVLSEGFKRTEDLRQLEKYAKDLEADIAEHKKAEEKIKASLKEKEVLLREIHHRVKNNLQVISSLLQLQSYQIENPIYQQLFKESINRIQTMGLIHSLLYNNDNFSFIDFTTFINKLCDNLQSLYMDNTGKISIKTDIKDVYLGLDTSIPCGLIVNELLSNSMKYAFPDNRSGEINIHMKRIEVNKIELKIADNGVGIPEDFDWENTNSIGLKLSIFSFDSFTVK